MIRSTMAFGGLLFEVGSTCSQGTLAATMFTAGTLFTLVHVAMLALSTDDLIDRLTGTSLPEVLAADDRLS